MNSYFKICYPNHGRRRKNEDAPLDIPVNGFTPFGSSKNKKRGVLENSHGFLLINIGNLFPFLIQPWKGHPISSLVTLNCTVFFVCFLSGYSFTDTNYSQDSRRKEGTMFYSSISLPLAHEHSDTYLQLCM